MNFVFSNISAPVSSLIGQLYEQAFPAHERRPWNEQLHLIKTGRLYADSITLNEDFAGFIFYWQLTDFVFIEHFAIAENVRGKGMGSKIVQQFKDRFDTIVLETEPLGISADASRRITFYEKAGFVLFDEAYMQPPYVQGGSWFPMRLLYHKPDNRNISFDQVKREIYAEVYGIK